MALEAARSSDYLSDCTSLFLHSSTAFAAAHSSDYTSNSTSSRLWVHIYSAWLRLHRCFARSSSRRRLSHSLLVGFLVGLHVTFCTLVDGFRGGSLIQFLFGLLLTFLILIDGFRGSSLIGLFIGLRVTFVTLVNGSRGSSLVGCLVALRVTFRILVDGSRDGLRVEFLVGLRVTFVSLVDSFYGGSLVGLLVGLRVSFLTLVDGFRGGSPVGLLVGLRVTFLTLVYSFRGGSLIRLLIRYDILSFASTHFFRLAKASLMFCALLFSSTAFARLAHRISRQIACHFTYTHQRLSQWLACWVTHRFARHFSHTCLRLLRRLSDRITRRIRHPLVCEYTFLPLGEGFTDVLQAPVFVNGFRVSHSSDYSSDCASLLLHWSTSSDHVSLFSHSLMAFAAARSSDYSSDCTSHFSNLLMAFAAARSSDYSSDTTSARLWVRISSAWLRLHRRFARSTSRQWLSRGSCIGLLVGLHVTFLTLVDRFRGGSLIRLLIGYDIRSFVSKHFFHLAKASRTFYALQFSSTGLAQLTHRITSQVAFHFSYTR